MAVRKLLSDEELSTQESGYLGFLRAVLDKSGVIAVIAVVLVGYLVWMNSRRMDQLQSTIVGNQSVIIGKLDRAQLDMTAFARDYMNGETQKQLLMKSQIILLRQLCVNAARSPQQIAGCIAVEEK